MRKALSVIAVALLGLSAFLFAIVFLWSVFVIAIGLMVTLCSYGFTGRALELFTVEQMVAHAMAAIWAGSGTFVSGLGCKFIMKSNHWE